MSLWDEITNWLRRPDVAELSPEAKRIITEKPEQFNRLYQQATGQTYAPPPPSNLRLNPQSPMVNLQNNADVLKSQPFQQIQPRPAPQQMARIPEQDMWAQPPPPPPPSWTFNEFNTPLRPWEYIFPQLKGAAVAGEQLQNWTENIVKGKIVPYATLPVSQYKEKLLNPEAVRQQYEQTEMPWGAKGFMEFALDPLMFVPGGGGAKAKAFEGAITRALKGGVDIPTIIERLVANKIPKTEAEKLVANIAEKIKGIPVEAQAARKFTDVPIPGGKLASLLEGKEAMSLREAYKLAKERGIVKDIPEFKTLLKDEIQNDLIGGGSGTGSRPQYGNTPYEIPNVRGYISNKLITQREVVPQAAKAGTIVKPTATVVETTAKGGIVPPTKPPLPPAVISAGAGKTPALAGNIRLNKFPEEAQTLLKDWADKNPQLIAAARRGIRSDEQVLSDAQKLAAEVGKGFDKKVTAWKPGQAWNAEELTALRGTLTSSLNDIITYRDAIQAGEQSSEILLKYTQALLEHDYLQKAVTGVTAEAGRALRAFRQTAFDAIRSKDFEKMEELLKRLGGRAKVTDIAKKLAMIDVNDPIAVNNFIRSVVKPKWYDYPIEIFYNSILSNPKTHIVNFGSNTLTAVLSPFERGIAAAVEAPLSLIQGRPRERFFGEVAQDIFGALRGIPEGVRAGLYSLKNGYTLEEVAKWEIKSKAFTGKAGVLINLPTRFLEAADMFGKAVNRTAALRAEAYRVAASSGLKGNEFLLHLNNLIQNPTMEMIQRASKVADYRLFRQKPGTFVNKLIGLRDTEIKGIPIMRFFVPFLRTPANLVKFGLERSPVGILNTKVWSDIAKKSPEAADGIAKWVIGSTIAATITSYVVDDKITGAAPTSPNERDLFYRMGKQPYSIKIGDKWISYQRIEPINQTLSFVAAVTEAIKDKKADTDITELVGKAMSTIIKNFVSQTYMSGIADFIDTMEDPERNAGKFIQKWVSGMVPYSGALRGAAQAIDTTIRQPGGFIEGIKSNLPILSKEVPAKIDIFGEQIERESPWYSPIYITTEKDDRVNKALSEVGLNFGFVGGAISGKELSEQETREYRVLAGNTLRDYLDDAVNSSEYQSLSTTEERKDYLESAGSLARRISRAKMMDKLGMPDSGIEKIEEQEARWKQNRAYDAIESQIWLQYPPQVKILSDEIIRLSKSGNRNDGLKARELLMQHPEILMARRQIAIQKAIYKRQQIIQGGK